MEDRVARATNESPVADEATQSAASDGTTAPIARGDGPRLSFSRRLSKPSVDPFSTVEWEKRDAVIQGEGGKTVFEQRDVEFPAAWSQLATNVVASKYFRGQLGTPKREQSVRQLIGRVVMTIVGWGEGQKYFATDEDRDIFRDELTHLLVEQQVHHIILWILLPSMLT